MHVNGELGELTAALEQAPAHLARGGRLCVITFHSLEDRLVKRFLRDHSRVDPALARLPVVPDSAQPQLSLPTRAIRPTPEEVAANPRARSATLRVAVRL
jgi:16S rRNA (cytosine1402-N4)-methyltransferase